MHHSTQKCTTPFVIIDWKTATVSGIVKGVKSVATGGFGTAKAVIDVSMGSQFHVKIVPRKHSMHV